MNFILKNWVKYYTKEIAKTLRIPVIGAGIILTVIVVKYKPAYQVTMSGDTVGYVGNKDKIELEINNYLDDTTGNVAFKELAELPEYEFKLINRNRQTQEEKIMAEVADSTKITYRTYAVTVDGNVQVILGNEEDAKNIAQSFKANMNEEIEMNVGIVEQFTNTLMIHSQEQADEIINTIKVAKINEYNEIQEAKRKAEAEELARRMPIATKTETSAGRIAGIVLTKPISGGSISSRYGSRSSIRSSAHTGLDIATASGTPVRPIAPGTVKFAEYKGSYGNLVIIDHGNGIESYYAHCSQIYCSVGEAVTTDTVISAVGSTGNSTGPHLHLEIRQNGSPLNPENYLY